MLKKSLLPALLVATALLPLSVAAAEKEQNYMGFTVGDGDWEDDDGNQLFGMKTLGIKLGHQFTDHLAFEGRYLTSISEDNAEPVLTEAWIASNSDDPFQDLIEAKKYGGTVRVAEPELNYLSINAILQTNLNDNLAVYAQGGIAYTRLTMKAFDSQNRSVEQEEDEASPTVGVGANIGKLNGIYINIEYSRLYQDSDASFDSFGFGLTGTF